jgi:nucleotide-binding universal stress UspA family protein
LIESIVVGTDGSDTAREAVRQAGSLARAIGASVHLVSAYEPVTGVRVGGPGGGTPEQAEWAVKPDVEVDTVLTEAVGLLRALGVEAATYARKGDPADAILDVADEEKADMIIVGSKGMKGSRRFLLGSVPDKISHHASCSVMIIRTIA